MGGSRKTGVVGIIITVIILVTLVITTNMSTERFSGAENIFGRLVMPVQNAVTHLRNRISRKQCFF